MTRPFDLLGSLPAPESTTVLEASAGTGKTFVLAGLVTRYLAETDATLDDMLLITFSRAATAELRERVREQIVAVVAAFDGADFIYAKNWSNYEQYGAITSMDPSWTVTVDKMKRTNDARFLHCLPVRRNMIVTDGVLDGPWSAVLEQAGNRVVSAQTILMHMVKELQA